MSFLKSSDEALHLAAADILAVRREKRVPGWQALVAAIREEQEAREAARWARFLGRAAA